MNTSRTRTIILLSGGMVIALAVLLFVTAMKTGDLSQPGQGHSLWMITIAFALLIGLAVTLLFMLFRIGPSAADTPLSRAKRRLKQRAAAITPEGEGLPVGVNLEGSSTVLSDTAGELRTSIGVIQEELEEILDDEAPTDKVHMQAIFDETDRLKKIIDSMEQLNRFLEIARLNRKELFQVEPLLQSVIEATRQAVPNKDVTYSLECEAGFTMEGDRECISRIIGNIADNAAQSIKVSGSVTLTADRRNGMVVFSVKDTGAGIRRAHLSHIYERFFRGSGTGIGMGLAIVKELVDVCGGKIGVQTASDKGTTFVVQIPG